MSSHNKRQTQHILQVAEVDIHKFYTLTGNHPQVEYEHTRFRTDLKITDLI